jgi:hypothetical protein
LIKKNPTATALDLEIVVEYIWRQKFATYWRYNRFGEEEKVIPSEPDFNLKGKTWDSLWRKALEWFVEADFAPKSVQKWEQFRLKNKYVRTETRGDFVFEQLLSQKELIKEGKQMNHCVGSYSRRCLINNSAIFSMQNILENKKTLVTVEINPQTRELIQARRRFNNYPSTLEQEIISEWLKQNDLKLSA